MHVSTNLDVDLVAVETADQVNLLLEGRIVTLAAVTALASRPLTCLAIADPDPGQTLPELGWVATGDTGLVSQGAGDGLGEEFALVQEGAG